ncbi:MAG: LacI family DNA-binding transcriptional regulator [Kiritimatiellae bacterium]|nr:LacI family DNA-binding transcriptional regulator [Kiritimatiellia bacterium]
METACFFFYFYEKIDIFEEIEKHGCVVVFTTQRREMAGNRYIPYIKALIKVAKADMATLKDIANRLGISHVAVSYAFNGNPGVSDETRRKVFEVAEEIGYRPHAGAVATRNGAFRAIGLVLSSDYDFSYFSQGLFSGFMNKFSELNYSLNITHIAPNQSFTSDNLPPTLRNKQVDGYIIYYTKQIPEYLTNLAESSNVQAIWVNTKSQQNCICPDDFQGSKMLTEYLLKLGHKKILYADLNMSEEQILLKNNHYSVLDREAGYIRAMEENGLSPTTFRFATTPEKNEMHSLSKEIIRSHDATAIISYSCNGALALRIAAESLGKSCPEDISIASFKEEISAFDLFDLTTAIVPDEQMGEIAVTRIIKAVETKAKEGELTLIPYTTIEKGYTTAELVDKCCS